MSTQIAVRLPDDLVAWIDQQVAEGGGSRAAVTTTALRRYQRQVGAARDAEIYRETGDIQISKACMRDASTPISTDAGHSSRPGRQDATGRRPHARACS
ncbi:ribbon-helix-helix domain-containing protein [Nocardioides humi]|uniref:ribbon-helix-helix domain-containing protein n=1 Tax=Nocardioides humi TaxID=449461 RepID=UPI00112905D7|nr:ribbon-helix-helix domain-containing protein [Nocardioides humi]